MKKIAIMAPYVGKINRGAESFVIELASRLKQKYSITVFSSSECEELADIISTVPVNKGKLFMLHERLYEKSKIYRRINWMLYYTIPDILYQKKFSKAVYEQYLKSEKYDMIFPNNGIWGVKYAKKCKNTPVIYTGHGGVGKGEKLILLEKPDMYICLTERQRLWAEKYSNKTILIPNGVDTDKFNNKLHKPNKIILSVGALTAFKRHHLTIKAMANIKDYKLVILGKGELEKELVELADKEIPNRYEIKSVEYSEMAEYYQQADVFVLPSNSGEAFGIVYLEALASNIPVVANKDSMREFIIGDAGILCNVTNIDEYSASIKKAIETDWRNMPRIQAEKFAWNIIQDKYEKMIDDLLT